MGGRLTGEPPWREGRRWRATAGADNPTDAGNRITVMPSASDALSVNLTRIEAVGPVIEATADAAGLRVVIDDLRAEIR
jgi:hypothetical protein